MPLILTWKNSTHVPIEGDILRPDAFAGRSVESVSRTLIRVGNAEAELGDLFTITGNSSEDSALLLEGDLRPVKRIGRGMAGGSIHVRGACGEGLGQAMHAGSITVDGSVGDSAGMAMRGGFLHVRGSAGDNLGGCEPGARLGMRDGVILVEGPIGRDAGLAMRRGLIAATGDCGDNPGRGMIAGSIFLFGDASTRHPGLGMKRGTIAIFGTGSPRLGPGFAPSGNDRPTFLTIYLKRLRDLGCPVPESAFAEDLARYNGDRAEGGQGEILIASAGGPRS